METVEIDSVDSDDKSYCISYPIDDSLLFSSIQHFGVLSPLVLLKGEHPVIVAGFKRLEAARRAGLRVVPCIFLNIQARQALLMSISDNLGRPLNVVEKAHSIEKMHALGFAKEEIYAVMKLLSIPARDETIKTSIRLASAGNDTKDFIAGINPPLSVIEQLFWFDDNESARIVTLARRFKTSMSHFREVVRLLMLAKVRLGSIDFGPLEVAAGFDELKQLLRHETNPMLTAMEERLARLSASCALPPNISVKVDPNFEKDSIEIRIQAKTDNELDNALRKLRAISDDGVFRSIFELTHGEAVHD